MPPPQSFENHFHRPRLWATGILAWLIAVIALVLHWLGWAPAAVWQVGLVVAVAVALLIGRVYITALQDRIIRLEMRVRLAAMLPPDRSADLERLSMAQVVALRFASDEELPALLDRAVKESLSPRDIKRAIRHWVPDLHRT
jgi:hypothetical protein